MPVSVVSYLKRVAAFELKKKKRINMLPATMNLMLKSVKVSFIYFTPPAPTEATLLRMPCSPSKQNASSKSLYNLRTGEAKVKSSLKLPWASKLRGFCPTEKKMIGNPFLPRSGMGWEGVGRVLCVSEDLWVQLVGPLESFTPGTVLLIYPHIARFLLYLSFWIW